MALAHLFPGWPKSKALPFKDIPNIFEFLCLLRELQPRLTSDCSVCSFPGVIIELHLYGSVLVLLPGVTSELLTDALALDHDRQV